jgi:ATP-dependent DNA ligase
MEKGKYSELRLGTFRNATAHGAKLLDLAERHDLECVVSKRKSSPHRSGPSRDWRKIKTAGWREANRER